MELEGYVWGAMSFEIGVVSPKIRSLICHVKDFELYPVGDEKL